MKHLLITLLATCLFTASYAQTEDIAVLKQHNENWIGAYSKKDTAALNKIVADDLVMITPNGSRIGKQTLLANVSKSAYVSAKVDSVEVKLLGNTALVIAKASFVTNTGGKETTGHTSYMDVYEKRNGRWVAVGAHVTFLGQR
ncbi:nuclear transport factor 2 family protein [Chitinophaga lutea]|uniref:Nuclear transport factor 2 family protein n=1 Tax=Chitinophaga lutea TaxID=2488634 RepID=A0A3N4PYH7_9BACT|nr:nuclear transport factor 2 family protein [Chitinophaga lutea]RPE08720.1 nuclear transport factor 2 family protein [Chitinophaga lutea]